MIATITVAIVAIGEIIFLLPLQEATYCRSLLSLNLKGNEMFLEIAEVQDTGVYCTMQILHVLSQTTNIA